MFLEAYLHFQTKRFLNISFLKIDDCKIAQFPPESLEKITMQNWPNHLHSNLKYIDAKI